MKLLHLLVLAACITATSAYADCATSSIGVVYCSKHPGGGALKDRIGTVQCGKGQCRKNSTGVIYCSKTPGGGAGVNSMGTVMCNGGCQIGATSMCETGKP